MECFACLFQFPSLDWLLWIVERWIIHKALKLAASEKYIIARVTSGTRRVNTKYLFNILKRSSFNLVIRYCNHLLIKYVLDCHEQLADGEPVELDVLLTRVSRRWRRD